MPRVSVLGDLCVDVDQPPPRMRHRTLEVIVYLALCPGRSEAAFNEAIFPEERRSPQLTKRRNEYMRLARRWVGADADGYAWIPEVPDGGYTIREGVGLDWRDFTTLVGSRPADRSTPDLEAALALVKGRPLTGIAEDGWEWAQAIKTQMCRQVAAVAHELADRGQREEDQLLALHAVEVGLQCVPEDPKMWDRAITIASATGGRSAANAMARRRQRWLED